MIYSAPWAQGPWRRVLHCYWFRDCWICLLIFTFTTFLFGSWICWLVCRLCADLAFCSLMVNWASPRILISFPCDSCFAMILKIASVALCALWSVNPSLWRRNAKSDLVIVFMILVGLVWSKLVFCRVVCARSSNCRFLWPFLFVRTHRWVRSCCSTLRWMSAPPLLWLFDVLRVGWLYPPWSFLVFLWVVVRLLALFFNCCYKGNNPCTLFR